MQMKSIIFKFCVTLAFILPLNAKESWLRLDAKKNDYLLVALEETPLAQKAGLGQWLPLAGYKVAMDGPLEWTLSSWSHKNDRMSIEVIIRSITSPERKSSFKFEWFNAGSTEIEDTEKFLEPMKKFFALPQHFSADPEVVQKRLFLFNETDIEMMKKKISISKSAPSWDWSNPIFFPSL